MPTTIERSLGSEQLIIETGKLAGLAHGSVTVRYGETIVLATAVMSEKPRFDDMDFLPLTVDYEERLYAAGKIPGSFFRREGRPGQEGILNARLTDRSIRPLFPKGLYNDIQITLTVLSADPEHSPGVLGMIGASAALSMSQIPFAGPIGACHLVYKDGEYIVYPTYQEVTDGQMDMMVASNRDAIMMVEAGSNEVSEEVVLEGIRRAHEANLVCISMIDDLVRQVGKPKVEFTVDKSEAETLQSKVMSLMGDGLTSMLEGNLDKEARDNAERRLEDEAIEKLAEDHSKDKVSAAFNGALKEVVRDRILNQGIRPDGRGTTEIRPITCEAGLLPRTHGSGLFTRGQTQVLSIVTVASMAMKQTLDTVGPDGTKRFMHHYNFPSFSTGEARRVGSPGRREIGHGALAERAIMPSLPSEEEFPYAIRIVSEVVSSNGSTSMGSVCGSTLALLDAGVPISEPVSGIAMGLVTGKDGQYAILSDIQGMEDFLGDMDFKVAGTRNGINALQMDIKLTGLDEDILKQALEQARVGRLHIMDKMDEVISQPRTEMSPYAPKMIRLKIAVGKIGALIGPGGRVIRGISEDTGTTINVEDDGSVTIGGIDAAMLEEARNKVDSLTRELQVGDIFTGKISKVVNFGAFVELMPGREGLVRSQDMGDMEDGVEVGQEITVMIQEIDSQGRLNLSRSALFGDNGGGGAPRPNPNPNPGFSDRGRGGRPGGFSGGRGGPGGPRPGGSRGPGGPGGPGGRPGGPDRRFLGGGGGPRSN
ncbi:MAG: polyribonucleotide nucleotidyltransferase [SAR202 cluster bacterium Io17-Chloro-G2]|nr:MAG: polyribonucleotide nucleotidyltransferase [SAR202 cluster bacterium Io17-Chloro-G2]